MPEISTVRVPHVVRAGLALVKGTRHQTEAAVTLDAHGPVGDRAFCLVDVARREVLRTVRNRSLVAVTATWDGEAAGRRAADRRDRRRRADAVRREGAR